MAETRGGYAVRVVEVSARVCEEAQTLHTCLLARHIRWRPPLLLPHAPSTSETERSLLRDNRGKVGTETWSGVLRSALARERMARHSGDSFSHATSPGLFPSCPAPPRHPPASPVSRTLHWRSRRSRERHGPCRACRGRH
eukprot:525737-Rhodomonas_salina.1